MMSTLAEMNNKELFNVLTGGQGVMAQYHLQQIILAYRHIHGNERADLQTMVREYLSNAAA